MNDSAAQTPSGGGTAVCAESLSKIYRLYGRHIDRLKESLDPRRRKYHTDFYALRDFSLEVRKGETIGIIGKNGSGKSTLLKLISGILTPTSGSITANGRIAALLELGAGFNPELTGMENIYFNGAIMGYSRREIGQKLKAITSFADIGVYIDQPVKTYSSGMFVRLAFAVAINVEPDILVIDEALAVGDMNFQAGCYRKFNEFRKSGKTVVFVTHALDSILRYCDRAVVLDAGRKAAETGPKEAVDIYKQVAAESYRAGQGRPPLKTETPHTRAPGALSYGDGSAEIIKFSMLDESGRPCSKFYNRQSFDIVMEVRFLADIEEPIFAYTLKDLKGLEITGTNTFFKHVPTGAGKRGETIRVVFSQQMNLQPGQYALSLGCTGYSGAKFRVYHRLYDVLLFEVMSDTPMVGFFDLHSRISVETAPPPACEQG